MRRKGHYGGDYGCFCKQPCIGINVFCNDFAKADKVTSNYATPTLLPDGIHVSSASPPKQLDSDNVVPDLHAVNDITCASIIYDTDNQVDPSEDDLRALEESLPASLVCAVAIAQVRVEGSAGSYKCLSCAG